jgi:GNAT superfamily N-acetyltransferase
VNVQVSPLEADSPWAAEIAGAQFAHWGLSTGFASCAEYERFLRAAAAAIAPLPRVLVASYGDRWLGSVNLLRHEMTTRPELSPWMGQLFVAATCRSAGVGTRLIASIAEHAAALGFEKLHLYAAGTLPAFYRARGWEDLAKEYYRGKDRTIMRLPLSAKSALDSKVV